MVGWDEGESKRCVSSRDVDPNGYTCISAGFGVNISFSFLGWVICTLKSPEMQCALERKRICKNVSNWFLTRNISGYRSGFSENFIIFGCDDVYFGI